MSYIVIMITLPVRGAKRREADKNAEVGRPPPFYFAKRDAGAGKILFVLSR